MSVYSIYKFCCIDETMCDKLYAGHSKNLNTRKRVHKNRCNNVNSNYYTDKVYQTIREFGGWNNWKMVEIEACDETINTKRQAEKREQYWIDKLGASLNTNRAFKTKQDKSDDNKKIYQENKEEIKAKQNKAYWEDPKKDNEKCKKYRENNPDKVAESNKKKNDKWQTVKDEKNAERRVKIQCGCGSQHSFGGTAKHLRTDLHKAWASKNTVL